MLFVISDPPNNKNGREIKINYLSKPNTDKDLRRICGYKNKYFLRAEHQKIKNIFSINFDVFKLHIPYFSAFLPRF